MGDSKAVAAMLLQGAPGNRGAPNIILEELDRLSTLSCSLRECHKLQDLCLCIELCYKKLWVGCSYPCLQSFMVRQSILRGVEA